MFGRKKKDTTRKSIWVDENFISHPDAIGIIFYVAVVFAIVWGAGIYYMLRLPF